MGNYSKGKKKEKEKKELFSISLLCRWKSFENLWDSPHPTPHLTSPSHIEVIHTVLLRLNQWKPSCFMHFWNSGQLKIYYLLDRVIHHKQHSTQPLSQHNVIRNTSMARWNGVGKGQCIQPFDGILQCAIS